MPNRFVTNGRSIPITHSGDVEAKEALLQGALFGLAVNGGAADDADELYVEGVIEIDKGSGVSFAKGANVYIDTATMEAKAIAAGYYKIGTAYAAAAGGDAAVLVRLDGTSVKDVDADVVNMVVPLVANGTSRIYLPMPVGKTITGVRAKRITALATGTITLALQNAAGTTLLSTANVDATALTASFVAQTLTATTADLAIAAGNPLQALLVSNDAGSTGGPAVLEITFAPAE
ncbi:MAG: DUF2190 family protein [Deltaproteobacteria bacterium]|nr:DUF2190 family protein [Deltaproteobacteria bacterium]